MLGNDDMAAWVDFLDKSNIFFRDFSNSSKRWERWIFWLSFFLMFLLFITDCSQARMKTYPHFILYRGISTPKHPPASDIPQSAYSCATLHQHPERPGHSHPVAILISDDLPISTTSSPSGPDTNSPNRHDPCEAGAAISSTESPSRGDWRGQNHPHHVLRSWNMSSRREGGVKLRQNAFF